MRQPVLEMHQKNEAFRSIGRNGATCALCWREHVDQRGEKCPMLEGSEVSAEGAEYAAIVDHESARWELTCAVTLGARIRPFR